MTSATATKATAKKTASVKSQSIYASTQSRFSTSKLIQNLGSSNDGVQFDFSSTLRTAYGKGLKVYGPFKNTFYSFHMFRYWMGYL